MIHQKIPSRHTAARWNIRNTSLLCLALWLNLILPTWAQGTASNAPPVAISAQVASSPDTSKLTVYRPGHLEGHDQISLIYVNGIYLAELHNKSSAAVELPPGRVTVVTSTFIFAREKPAREGLVQPPSGRWASSPGCVSVNWKQPELTPFSDLSLCRDSIIPALREFVDPSARISSAPGMCESGCTVFRFDYRIANGQSNLNDERIEIVKAAPLLDWGLAARSVQLDLEAGKQYYVRVSNESLTVSDAVVIGDVDPAVGARESAGLQDASKFKRVTLPPSP